MKIAGVPVVTALTAAGVFVVVEGVREVVLSAVGGELVVIFLFDVNVVVKSILLSHTHTHTYT